MPTFAPVYMGSSTAAHGAGRGMPEGEGGGGGEDLVLDHAQVLKDGHCGAFHVEGVHVKPRHHPAVQDALAHLRCVIDPELLRGHRIHMM